MEQKLLSDAQVLSFEGTDRVFETPAYYFTKFSKEDQLDAVDNLARAVRKEGKSLIYELGYGTSLSPLDSAGAGKNRVVLAFDILGQFPENLRNGSDNVKIPDKQSGSLAAFFKLDVRDIIKRGNPVKADLAYSIVPFPNLAEEMIKLGLELSDNVYVVPNPLATTDYPPEDIIKRMPSKYLGEVLMLTKSEIEATLGTSKSGYLTTLGPSDKTPILHAYLPHQ